MRSADPLTERDRRRVRALGQRVARAAIGSALAAGAAAGITAAVAVDRVVSESMDKRLLGAALVLAGELQEEALEQEGETIEQVVADENSEIHATGIRLAVLRGEQRIAGDSDVPAAAAQTCRTAGVVGARVRSCAQAYEELTLVAAQRSDGDDTRWFYLAAGLGALLIGGLVGVATGSGLSRWALSPLSKLTTGVRRISATAPAPSDLGPPSDCAEVAAIQAAIAELLSRLKQELDRTRRFAADAAHELRTPLTTLRAEVELLLEQTPESGREELERIAKRSEQLSTLIDRLLVLAAPLHDAAAGFETLALAELIEDVVRMMPPAERARVDLELAGEGLVRGDAALLSSLVNNALDNALKFSGSSRVRLELVEASGAVRMRVEDRGPGIPRSERDLVFQPFYRARRGDQRGHGLGLALIAHITRAHEGHARFVDSESGACLQVDLPAWKATTATTEAQRVNPQR